MDQRDFHCPYSLSSEITAKPTVLGLLVSDYYYYYYVTYYYYYYYTYSSVNEYKRNKTDDY